MSSMSRTMMAGLLFMLPHTGEWKRPVPSWQKLCVTWISGTNWLVSLTLSKGREIRCPGLAWLQGSAETQLAVLGVRVTVAVLSTAAASLLVIGQVQVHQPCHLVLLVPRPLKQKEMKRDSCSWQQMNLENLMSCLWWDRKDLTLFSTQSLSSRARCTWSHSRTSLIQRLFSFDWKQSSLSLQTP